MVVVAQGIVSAVFDYILNKGSLEKFYYLCDYTPFAAPFGYYLNEDGSGFDLHKHYIDQITLKGKNGSALRRIPDVLDCWFESGSMPFAQLHYPFENEKKFKDNFPAQFIAEGVDQPRTWFYYLHVLAVAIMGKPSFKNVIVNGIVLAEDGKKMSKRLQNYPDPMAIFNKYGADAVRYYLACSPVLRAEDLNFSEKGVEEVVKKVLLILYNVLSFYKLYSDPNDPNKHPNDANILDEWMIAKTWLLIDEVAIAYNSYDLNRAARPITGFINDLSTWYLRRSRDRFKGDDEKDKKAVLGTLRWTLEQLALVMSPVMPFTAEYVWQELGNKESVHLAKWPDKQKIKEVGHIMNRMDAAKIIVELGLAKRAEKGIKIRQPLQKIIVKGEELDKEYTQLIIDELNVKTVEFQKGDGEHVVVELDMAITPELKLEGHLRELVRTINGRRKKAGLTPGDVIAVTYQTDSEELRKVFVQYGEALKKAVIAGEIKSSENDGETMEINGEQIKISIQKYKLQVTSFKLQDREEFCGNLETGNL
ncbi:MAG: hypothetical protein A3H70_04065 [Candidatus Komeilibacteria bacterium RIFCSPLOWO2_02_FULL_48_11]|uniref:Isoleucine--tRNA ligase n=1 Tax=Candidatus Komeilibacteria bacterium RIFCSPLOWO2_02_FULL_48_11 TaxID=1798553 RepID=A0A1G2BP26_9BACT|nr:MAG: hypothetical protein A3H70_04065 [Candidatus Komeilibacteria bacterium RIFCSPLOWO2_02_FULL_48_11]